MTKKLSQTTWKEIKFQMSIAGDPEKITILSQEIMKTISHGINTNSIPEIDNMQFALQRIIAELKLWEKSERKRQHPTK